MYFFYFYPVSITTKQYRQPVLSRILMVFMLVAFIWMRYFPNLLSVDPNNLVFYPGSGRIWTVVTAIFMHGGWLHLLGNMIYFNVFAPVLESRVGAKLFLFYFLMMGVFGNLAHGLVASQGWFGQYGVGVLGASGAIAGLLAFSMIRFHCSRVEIAWWMFAPMMGQNKVGRTKVPLLVAVALWFLLQVVHSLVASQTGASVSYGAHFGGFIMGLVLALFLGQWREGNIEGLRLKAEEYFREGAFHASVGSWIAYLEKEPFDLMARLELARAQVLTGETVSAELNYRRVFLSYLKRSRADKAVDVFIEANRAQLSESFKPGELARVAFFQEKQMKYAEAAVTHQILFSKYPGISEGKRSLVRLVMLHRGKIDDASALEHWLQTADKVLAQDSWRAFLETELRNEGGLGGESGANHQYQDLQPKL